MNGWEVLGFSLGCGLITGASTYVGLTIRNRRRYRREVIVRAREVGRDIARGSSQWMIDGWRRQMISGRRRWVAREVVQAYEKSRGSRS